MKRQGKKQTNLREVRSNAAFPPTYTEPTKLAYIMADVFTKEKRAEVMGRVRSRGNKGTELRLVAIFKKYGVTGWRRNWKLMGKPDFVFPKERVAVFTDGCFWHGCPAHGRIPKSNRKFWREKIARNQARDLEVTKTLRRKGWRVLRIWEHALTAKFENRTAARLRRMGLLA